MKLETWQDGSTSWINLPMGNHKFWELYRLMQALAVTMPVDSSDLKAAWEADEVKWKYDLTVKSNKTGDEL